MHSGGLKRDRVTQNSKGEKSGGTSTGPRPLWSGISQLSEGTRVTEHVASIALDRGALLGGPGSEAHSNTQVSMPETPVLEMLSDAEVMLRVAGGDTEAFDYLVEKF